MPVIPVEMCLPGAEITDSQVRPGGQWVSAVLTVNDAHEPGPRTVLAMWRTDGADHNAPMTVLLADPMPMAGRALTSGVHGWHPDGQRVCVVTREGLIEVSVSVDTPVDVRVLSIRPSNDAGAQVDPNALQLSSPVYSTDGTTLLVVADWSTLLACDLATNAWRVLHGPHDFVVDPSGDVRGDAVVWYRPDMSWTGGYLWPGDRRDGVSAQQPRVSEDGRSRGWIDDETDRWNVVIDADDVVDRRVRIVDEHEHAGPVWGPGQRTWCFSADGRFVAYTRNEDGYSTLNVYDRVGDKRTTIGRGVHGCLSWSGATLVAIRQGAKTPSQLVRYDMSSLTDTGGVRRTIIHDTRDNAWAAIGDEVLVEPTVMRTGRGIVYRLYEPVPSDRTESTGTIVWIHGGPIDQWQVTFRPRFSYWISRGWRIAVVDHRGTTGHGRAFREALHGAWGVADVEDTLEVIDSLRTSSSSHTRVVDPIVMMGSSAGGFTALNVAAHEPTVAAVIVCYPVCDLSMLLADDDPFEGHYTPTLVGADVVDDAAELRRRSPVGRSESLARVPTLIFHGDSDHSVPLRHSEELVRAVSQRGGEIELCVMAGEGHGFKKPESIRREYDLTERFLDRVLNRHR